MTPKPEHGLGLIEVLMAMAVLSVGLLGATALRAQAQAASQNADWHHLALLSAQDMAQALRSNPLALELGAYHAPQADAALETGALSCHNTPCAPTARAEHDVQRWRQTLAERLPAGRGALLIAGPTQRRLVVMWSSPSNPVASPCAPPWPRDFNCLSLEVSL